MQVSRAAKLSTVIGTDVKENVSSLELSTREHTLSARNIVNIHIFRDYIADSLAY